MTLRRWAKWRLHGATGAFPYFGVRVYFPRRSVAFRDACEQGIYEAENVHLLQCLCRAGTFMFDVGANLGLMAIPVLHAVPDSRVVSFEPSPNTLPSLRRTIANSSYRDRWHVVGKAVGAELGTAGFSLSISAESPFDGFRHTQRSVYSRQVEVEVTTIDLAWSQLGSPDLSVIKIDVEGAELEVLRGGRGCLDKMRPLVLLEWCPLNLKAYEIRTYELFYLARECNYSLYAMPALIPITSASDLEVQLLRTESFLMAPTETKRG